MSRTFCFFVCSTVILILASGTAQAREEALTGSINFSIGQRSLDYDQWNPVETEQARGLEVDMGRSSWFLRLYLSIFESSSDVKRSGEGEYHGDMREYGVGIKTAIKPISGFVPYVAAGVTWISWEQRYTPLTGDPTVSHDSFKNGYFLTAGVTYQVAKHFHLGIAGRSVSNTESTVNLKTIKADYIQYMFVAGSDF